MFAAQGAWLRFKMAIHVMRAWQTKQPHVVGCLGTTHRTGNCVKVLQFFQKLQTVLDLLLFGERHITFDYINSLTKLPYLDDITWLTSATCITGTSQCMLATKFMATVEVRRFLGHYITRGKNANGLWNINEMVTDS